MSDSDNTNCAESQAPNCTGLRTTQSSFTSRGSSVSFGFEHLSPPSTSPDLCHSTTSSPPAHAQPIRAGRRKTPYSTSSTSSPSRSSSDEHTAARARRPTLPELHFHQAEVEYSVAAYRFNPEAEPYFPIHHAVGRAFAGRPGASKSECTVAESPVDVPLMAPPTTSRKPTPYGMLTWAEICSQVEPRLGCSPPKHDFQFVTY